MVRVGTRPDRPRVSAYVAMLPVDAAPFLGDRPPDTALSLPTRERLRTTRTRGDRACRATHESTAGDADCRCSTKTRASRSSTRAPPGEEGGESFGGLTPLGRRLVGLDERPASGVVVVVVFVYERYLRPLVSFRRYLICRLRIFSSAFAAREIRRRRASHSRKQTSSVTLAVALNFFAPRWAPVA